jgi:hypothetical protein
MDMSIMDMIWLFPNPFSSMAPERHDATHRPQPLHKADSISALSVFSLNLGAE